MSASLVGSEMCIRDRPRTDARAPPARAARNETLRCPQVSPGHSGRPCLLYTSDAADECSV
eukprot:8497929-Alexandrium_andersonii.AAC.1